MSETPSSVPAVLPQTGLTKLERVVLVGTLVLFVAAGLARYISGVPSVAAFVIAGLALAGQAWMVSIATEQLGAHLGPALAGTLQATVGNVPEFFVVLFALEAGETTVAQMTLLGSILMNALLVLGMVLIAGAWKSKDGIMRFSARLPNDEATLMLVASFLLVLLGISHLEHDPAGKHAHAISIVGAILMLIIYGVWLRQYLMTGGGVRGESGDSGERGESGDPKERGESGDSGESGDRGARNRRGVVAEVESEVETAIKETPRLQLRDAIILVVLAGVGAAFTSDWFVHALQPSIRQLHISEEFAGLVIVALAGNAVEHGVGVVLAWKGQSELAIAVVKTSVAQIAAFLYPLVVIASLLTASSLTFSMPGLYIGALLLGSLLVWQITGDGEATVFEGAALVATFVVLATIAAFE